MIKKLLVLCCAVLLTACGAETLEDADKKIEKAAKAGDLEEVKAIIDKHPQLLTDKTYNALYWPVDFKKLEIVKWLVENGADVSYYCDKGNPLVFYAYSIVNKSNRKAATEVVKYLLNKG